jgi:hypothetical protein
MQIDPTLCVVVRSLAVRLVVVQQIIGRIIKKNSAHLRHYGDALLNIALA